MVVGRGVGRWKVLGKFMWCLCHLKVETYDDHVPIGCTERLKFEEALPLSICFYDFFCLLVNVVNELQKGEKNYVF